jgi:cobalt-zinc-cadmium efflux system outer membrane protein
VSGWFARCFGSQLNADLVTSMIWLRSRLSMGLLAAVFIFLSACTLSCAMYTPGRLRPSEAARQFVERKLAGPDLCKYLRANRSAFPTCPPPRWDLAALTLAAFFYSPELAVAEAKLNAARAAIITASQRPNPTIGIGPAYTASAVPRFAPWAIGAAELNFPIETAGKRGYRIAQAEYLANAAALGVGETAWHVRSAVRMALLNHVLAQRDYDLAQAYESASEGAAQLLQERVSAGAASVPELNFVLANLAAARLKAAQAQTRVPDTLNTLAGVVGVPVDAIQGMTFAWAQLERPPDESGLTEQRIRELALLNRIDLRRMLAEYAAADEALELDIARQYPDINLGGGYSWEVGENIFQLVPIITLPLMNQNQGPIAEARAKRTQVAAEFTALQQSIIVQSNGALTRYRGSRDALLQASNSAAFSQKRLAGIERAAKLGDIDALALATTRLETIVAKQGKLTALAQAQAALVGLEDAVQLPLEPDDLELFTPPPLRNPAGEQAS